MAARKVAAGSPWLPPPPAVAFRLLLFTEATGFQSHCMKDVITEGKYRPGALVYSKEDLSRKYVVRRFISRIYYCRPEDQPEARDLVFFERELTSDAELDAQENSSN